MAEKEHELGNSTFGRTVETAYHSRFQQFMTSLIPMHFYTSGTTLGYIYNHNSPAHRFFQHRQEPIVARCITASERFHHDLTVLLQKDTTAEEINAVLKEAAEGELKGIMGYSDEPLVSRDYNGCPLSSIIDGLSTMMVGPRMAKVVSWYDNEWGYSNRVVDLAAYIAKKGL